jgi:hypothetical protein
VAKVIASHVTRELTPYAESQFLRESVGCRPGRSPWEVFAAIERLGNAGPLCIVQADLQRAFDSVRIAAVLEDFAAFGFTQEYRPLLETLNSRKSAI